MLRRQPAQHVQQTGSPPAQTHILYSIPHVRSSSTAASQSKNTISYVASVPVWHDAAASAARTGKWLSTSSNTSRGKQQHVASTRQLSAKACVIFVKV
jgi:hypothetical protein